MTLDEITRQAVRPALAILGLKDTPEALVLLLTIGLQESEFGVRRQYGNGPGRSFW